MLFGGFRPLGWQASPYILCLKHPGHAVQVCCAMNFLGELENQWGQSTMWTESGHIGVSGLIASNDLPAPLWTGRGRGVGVITPLSLLHVVTATSRPRDI